MLITRQALINVSLVSLYTQGFLMHLYKVFNTGTKTCLLEHFTIPQLFL